MSHSCVCVCVYVFTICHESAFENMYAHGCTVGNIDDEYISVYCERPDENGEKEMYFYDCPVEEFRDYFLMNYCSTTHKSQGETITENYTIYDWKHMTGNI
jgi:hypothetical protein